MYISNCLATLFYSAVVRRELSVQPSEVFFTGHSLGIFIISCCHNQSMVLKIVDILFLVGGAIATLAALDVSINSIPRINAYLKSDYLRYDS